MPITATAIAGVVKGGIDFFSANKQLKEDEAELAGLTPAFYKVQDEYYGNRNSAAELAQGGLTQGSKDFYGDMAGRGLGTGVSATLQAGGSPNDISRIFDSYNQGIKSLASADSEAQINNIKYFHQVNKDLAGQKTTQWGVNEYQPYQNKLKELTERINADKVNKNNAINSAIGSVSSYGVGKSNEKLLSSLFGNKEDGSVEDPFKAEKLSNIASDFDFSKKSEDGFSTAGKLSRTGFSSNTGINFGNVAKMAMQQFKEGQISEEELMKAFMSENPELDYKNGGDF